MENEILNKIDFDTLEKTYFERLKSQPKPSWDKYFMRMAALASTRSIDPSSKCGCVITDQNNIILSVGYNGPVQGMDDSKIPLTRPEKYYYFAHAEENAILFCNNNISKSTAYVNSKPCSRCTRMMAQKGVKNIVYGNLKTKCCSDEIDTMASKDIIEQRKMNIKHLDYL